MHNHNIFNSLARNGFEFLQRAIAEFDQAPKYSVIHFCSAVETLLKARLMQEHWSLVVARPEQANHTKFKAGDFKSVTLEDCRARLSDIAGEDMGEKAYNSFRILANHRNKMVHFFHPGLENDQKAKERIAAEQCLAWFYLEKLLGKWHTYFSEFHEEIARAGREMSNHKKYLRVKFTEVQPELEAQASHGRTIKTCSACGYQSAISDPLDERIEGRSCLVCNHNINILVEMDCPHCQSPIELEGQGYTSCPRCSEFIEPKHVMEALDDYIPTHLEVKDGEEPQELTNCGLCDGYQTVIKRKDFFFCTSCFSVSEKIYQCDWCSEYNTDDFEQSYIFGCSHCDGKLGWAKDN